LTVAEALAAFDDEWVGGQPVTPRTAYQRTLRLLVFWRDRMGRSGADDLATFTADDLRAFVAWHAASGLADDADGSRKVAVHVARLGGFLAEHAGRADLALDRDVLRALV